MAELKREDTVRRYLVDENQFKEKLYVRVDVNPRSLRIVQGKESRPRAASIDIETNKQLEKLINVLTHFKGKLNENPIDWMSLMDKEYGGLG